ncbi:MAG: DUF4845 domain-containing protein [Acidiferrobacter sp.]
MAINHERGMTFLGILMLAVLAGVVVLLVVKLTPIYISNWQVEQSLVAVAHRSEAATMDRSALRAALSREFDVGYVSNLDIRSDLVVERTRRGRLMIFTYDVRTPFVYNITLLLHFVDRQRIPS